MQKKLKRKLATIKKKKPYKKPYGSVSAVLTSNPNKGEKKVLDTVYDGPQWFYNEGGGTSGLKIANLMAPGSSYFQRVGSKITMVSLQLRGEINLWPPLTQEERDPNPCLGRIIVVYDRQINGVIPNTSNVLELRKADGTATFDAAGGINMDFRDRFLVLWEQTIYFPAQANANITGAVNTTTNKGHNELLVDAFIKLPNLVATFDKGTTPNPAIGDIKTGGLLVLFVTDGKTKTRNCAVFSRLRYYDN
jgi:hypothetical protein